jgi:hypothetical protein
MTTLMERIANERRRLRSVREKMLAAIEQKSQGNEAYVPFYIAAADYIDATMQRVHAQDVKMDSMIREKVEAMDASVEKPLAELKHRLDEAHKHLKPFLAARDALQEKGSEALDLFEQEGRKYSDFIVASMGHHPPTADLGARLFSPGDWEYMAGVTDEDIKREAELFDQLERTTPDSLKNISA